jgi:citrate/tricarballylate utilization protein
MAQVRAQTYQDYAWPRGLAVLFERNGLAIAIIASLSVAAFIIGFVAFNDPSVLFATHVGPNSFYRIMPHNAMVLLFGGAFVYAILAMGMSIRMFWRDIGEPTETLRDVSAIRQATEDAGKLRYLDGGGVGCMNDDERPTDNRRIYHHLTFYGFMLCLASTTTATFYHYIVGHPAPYAWYDLPVLLGTLGGIGLLIGPVGLLMAKRRRDRVMQDEARFGGDVAFVSMLFFTSLTGLALLVFRSTPAMGILLAVHLGVVFGFFITMPYSKFVHGLYRYVALVRYARESRALAPAAHKA